MSTPDARQPAPHKGRREIIAIFWSLIGTYLLAALITWSPNDSGWSRLGEGSISNMGGAFGAWLSDVLVTTIGHVAIAIPIFIFIQVIGQWRKEPPLMNLPWRILSLSLTLLAMAALASLHFSNPSPELQNAAGGIGGFEIARTLTAAFGVFGGTLLLISVTLVGITVATGLSWFWLMDVVGHAVWDLGTLINSIFSGQFHAQRDAWRERRAMKKALDEAASPSFELALSNPKVKAQISREEPIRHEPVLAPAQEPPRRPKPRTSDDRVAPIITPMDVTPVKKSERAQKEKQRGLFDVMSVSGTLPSLSLLDAPDHSKKTGYSPEALEGLSRLLEIKLKEFNVDAAVVAVHPGPVITRFEIQPAPGVKVARIANIAKDLARSLAMISVRVVEVIPGKSVVGIEVPNEDREIVRLSEILSSETYESKESPLTLALGKDIAGKAVVADLARMPHLLVAGTTGSGKSVGVNAMLLSILYKGTPDDVRLILIDPKMLELSVYDKIPHLLTPVVTDMKDAANALRWCVGEMERRYKLMAAMGVRNLAGFNKKIEDAAKLGETIPNPLWRPGEDSALEETAPALTKLPYVVVIIDEFADMIMVVGKKVEELIARIAQKARAAGIHLILATQRPSVDVITGLIKANIPTRIGFQVSSKIDSRTILDQGGAEQLLGHGDMLYLAPGTSLPERVHGAYVSDEEVHRVCNDWRARGQPNYIDEILEGTLEVTDGGRGFGGNDEMGGDAEADQLYDQAVAFVLETRRPSISFVQRKFKIGYNRAARLVEAMELAGVVSAMQSNGQREVVVPHRE
ncbi:MAG TPA: DNA translocase FtsK 4TM domain-containing protein [Moraxellaceae bacterium]|nr:DNA translocase FtsK 4TM domain-containing protein [Moraxellaceae bacterium]HQX89517.1 DNA translocase FtsK 4TM domain-containing protein [Moraxellaceae bacterium]